LDGDFSTRIRLATSRNSFLPPAVAATCFSTGSAATTAAALIDISPALMASTSSGTADFWIFSICPRVALLRRAVRAISCRDGARLASSAREVSAETESSAAFPGA
jgi:hypothetical protein